MNRKEFFGSIIGIITGSSIVKESSNKEGIPKYRIISGGKIGIETHPPDYKLEIMGGNKFNKL